MTAISNENLLLNQLYRRMKNIIKVADTCFVNCSSFQDRLFYNLNADRESKCHAEGIDSAHHCHSEGKMVEKQKHLMEIFSEMQKHFQTLNSDLLSTTKENGMIELKLLHHIAALALSSFSLLPCSSFIILERDMFDHRNQQFSTILVAATIMLGSLVAVLAQGVLHEDSQKNSFLVVVYSISNSLSMSFLFICDVFCMGILWRASQFMKNRSTDHYGQLEKAIRKTKEMVRSIRGVKEGSVRESTTRRTRRSPRCDSEDSSDDYGSCRDHVNNPVVRDCKRRIISHMTSKKVADEFTGHETEVHRYLEKREGIIDKSAYMIAGDDDTNMEMKSFECFWQESCSFYANMAVLMFYLGSGSLIFANGIFVSSTFFFRYRSLRGGNITFTVIFFTLPLAFCLLVYMRYIESIPMDLGEDEKSERIDFASITDRFLGFLQLPSQLYSRLRRRYYDQYSEISSSNDDSSSVSGSGSDNSTMGSRMSGFYQSDRSSSTDISSMNSGQSQNIVHDIELIPLHS